MVDPMPTFRAATRLCVKIRLLVYIAKGGPLKLAKVNFPYASQKLHLGSGKGEKYVKCLNHQYKISSLGILPLSLVSGCWAGYSIYPNT